MAFVNLYDNPLIIVGYSEEFKENDTQYIYTVGFSKKGTVLVKTTATGENVWQKNISSTADELRPTKLIQLLNAGVYSYILSASSGRETVLFSFGENGNLNWTKKIENAGGAPQSFLEPVRGTAEFYFVHNNVKQTGTINSSRILKMDVYGNLKKHKQLKEKTSKFGLTITAVQTHAKGLVIAAIISGRQPKTILMNLDANLKATETYSISKPHLKIQSIRLGVAGLYTLSAYDLIGKSAVVAQIKGVGSQKYYTFPNTEDTDSTLASDGKNYYLCINTASKSIVHALKPDLSINWSKQLKQENSDLLIRSMTINGESRNMTLAVAMSLLIHSNTQMESCLTQDVKKILLPVKEMQVTADELEIAEAKEEITTLVSTTSEFDLTARVLCKDVTKECIKNDAVCALYENLKSVISKSFEIIRVTDSKKQVVGAKEFLKLIAEYDQRNRNMGMQKRFLEELKNIKSYIQLPKPQMLELAKKAIQSILKALYELGNCDCKKPGEDIPFQLQKNAIVQSEHLYLQAAGSIGVDSTKGMHLRWMLRGKLENHIPKGNYARTTANFNKAEDFVKIYRAPYVPLKKTFYLNTIPARVENISRIWLYDIAGEIFYVHFYNFDAYNRARAQFNPLVDPANFMRIYGNNIIEIEHKTKLSFAVTANFVPQRNNSSIQIEFISVADHTLGSIRKTSLRKKYTVNQLTGKKHFSENIRSVRFACEGCTPTSFEFELYDDFIQNASQKKLWTYLGKHALTLDTPTAFKQLEPVVGSVNGVWLHYNDSAFVNTANYKAKWNSPQIEEQARMQKVVEKYIELSNDPQNALAIENVPMVDPDAEYSEGYEPSENTYPLSNLDLLKMSSMDYHIARMLGLGVLDLQNVVFEGAYIYMAEYLTVDDLQDGKGPLKRQHLFCSLPTALTDNRLPLPIELKDPLPGIYQGYETGEITALSAENGYSHDGRTRFITLFHEALPEEEDNAGFFYKNYEFISAQSTIPVYAGIEYKETHKRAWVKPELAHVKDFYNIDSTVPLEQTQESRPIIIPENGFPIFVHREKNSGSHDYGSYGINWFGRATSSPKIHTIITEIVPNNNLRPPANINALLIQEEDPLLFTTSQEQETYRSLPEADRTLVRICFDYNHNQELINYHKEIDGEQIEAYRELPDAEELFAEKIEIFFKNELPLTISGKIALVRDDAANPLLAELVSAEYELTSQGEDPENPGEYLEKLSPVIPAGMEGRFIGSALSVDGQNFIVHQIDNTREFPILKVFKNTRDGIPVSIGAVLESADMVSPPAEKQFVLAENLQSPANWFVPRPLNFKVNIDLNAIHREEIIVVTPEGTRETHLQKFRGVYENAEIEKVDEEYETELGTGNGHVGLYKLTFRGFTLPEHSQHALPGHQVKWSRGVVRVHTQQEPNGPTKNLEVITSENIGTAHDLILYAVDLNFDKNNPDYNQIRTGLQKVNYYPGYKVYLKQDSPFGLDKNHTLPTAAEEVHYSVLGLRSLDEALGLNSPISMPAVIFAQNIQEPKQPEMPQGGTYATRPDYFGKASYTFTTVFQYEGEGKPYSVQYLRASDVQMMGALWRNDNPQDAEIWTVKRIKEEIFQNGNALWYTERWQNLLGFEYNYPENPEFDGQFKMFDPDENGTGGGQLPLPNNPTLIIGINKFIDEHNDTFGTSVDPLEEITSLHQLVIPAGPNNRELQLLDFVRDALHRCFVPLTEIPVICKYIKGKEYKPIPKKQVIRDERGELLKPEDLQFDMAPMMKTIGPDPSSVPVKLKYETQFTDFGIDGASNAHYFYVSREFNLKMKAGSYSGILGPISLVNTAAPRAPELLKVLPVFEDRYYGIQPAVEMQINAYPAHQGIEKIAVYRATSMQEAMSIRSMKLVNEIELDEEMKTANVWKISDQFSDLDYVPYGDPLFYNLVALRQVKYNDRDGNLVTEYQPSEPSKLTVTNIIETYNPETPQLSYESSPVNAAGKLENVVLTWEKKVHNGKYHLYRKNEKGVWIKIHTLQDNGQELRLSLADTELESGTLATLNAAGEMIYHVFKMVAENFAGMLSKEEKILSIGIN